MSGSAHVALGLLALSGAVLTVGICVRGARQRWAAALGALSWFGGRGDR